MVFKFSSLSCFYTKMSKIYVRSFLKEGQICLTWFDLYFEVNVSKERLFYSPFFHNQYELKQLLSLPPDVILSLNKYISFCKSCLSMDVL